MPATAIWLNCPTGHGARNSSTSGSKITSTPRKRNSRKVSGGAYGKPNLATIKPVLHNNTKKPGKAIGVKVARKDVLLVAPAAAGGRDMATIQVRNTAPAQCASGETKSSMPK